MRHVVIAAVLFAVVGAGIGCTTPPPPPAPAAQAGTPKTLVRSARMSYNNAIATTLILYADGTECKAEVEDDPVGGPHENAVTWVVVTTGETPCATKDAYPKVSLEFAPNGDGEYPFKDKVVKSKWKQDIVYVTEKIKKDTEVKPGTFKYTVYLLNGKTQSATAAILDPDLEVEPPPTTVTTTGTSTAPPAPAKKQ